MTDEEQNLEIQAKEIGTNTDEPHRSRKRSNLLSCFVLFSILFVLAAVIVPNFIIARIRGGGSISACKSNLKNLGTAFEMYSTDWSGKYPPIGRERELLAPNYLKTIPECPSSGTDSYTISSDPSGPYNTEGFTDYYYIQCTTAHHEAAGGVKNFPQYDGITGLIEP